MTLIKSISGIRGTIGGKTGDTLNPLDIVKFTTAYAMFLKNNQSLKSNKIIVGRDARISGEMVKNVVCGTLMGMGFDVVNIGLASTPTTELAVILSGADGGIIITASHNPKQWNALKLLNCHGEFLSADDGKEILDIVEKENFEYADVDHIGKYSEDNSYDDKHIENVLNLRLVDSEKIRKSNFKVCIDAINSVGGIIVPKLLDQLNVEYKIINGTADGNFSHNPEPLEKNLTGIMSEMKSGNFDLGIVVDPDVDRLAFICENGEMFGEEYTLVSIADYVLSHTPGSTVSNLSSTRALRDVTTKYGAAYFAAAVGEVNVTTKMKEVNAIIGGEGNGGVIYPESHYGRDAIVGIALFLSLLSEKQYKLTELRKKLPNYYIAKNKLELNNTIDIDKIFSLLKQKYSENQINDIDGVKIDFPEKWVHMRKSNTEPIIRIYSEAKSPKEAQELGEEIINAINSLSNK